MAKEERARTKGSVFARIFKKDEGGQWTHALMVYNYRKDLTEKVMRSCVESSAGPDGKINPDRFAERTRNHEFVEKNFGGSKIRVTASRLLEISRGNDGNISQPALVQIMEMLIVKRIYKREGWGLLGGGIKEDETPEEAVVRELFEEGRKTIDIGDEKLHSSLESLAGEIKIRNEGTSFLAMAMECRHSMLKEYAEKAKEFGLLIPVPRLNEDDPDKHSPVYVFEVDAPNLIGPDDAAGVGDPANNTTNPTWFTREQLEDCGRNYDSYAKNGPIHVYSSHLERLEIPVIHEKR